MFGRPANLAPDPETRTLEKPKARNLLAISALLANCSTKGEGCPVSLSLVDNKFAGEAPIDVDGGYSSATNTTTVNLYVDNNAMVDAALLLTGDHHNLTLADFVA